MNAPAALATASYTYTNASSTNAIIHNKDWFSVASSATGQYLYAGTIVGDLYRSADYGATWTNASTGYSAMHNLIWQSITTSANGQYVVAGTSATGLFRSTDYGVTWTDVSTASGPQASFIMSGLSSSSTGQYMVAGNQYASNIYVSSDYGATWTAATGMGTGATWVSGTISSTGQYQYVDGGSTDYLWMSSDYGATWATNTALGIGNWQGLTTSANGQYLAITKQAGDIYTSSNYGASWTDAAIANPATASLAWRRITSSASGQYLTAVVVAGDLWTSANYGVTWTDISTGNAAITGKNWSPIASSSTGQRVIAPATGTDVYLGNNPGLTAASTNTITNVVSAQPVSLDLPMGTVYTTMNSSAATSMATQDSGYTYPAGLVDLSYTTANASDQVTLTFVTDLTPSQVTARDYNSSTHQYVAVPGAVITATTLSGQHALQLSYNLVDNGPLDTNSAVGTVSDPVGLALTPSAPNTGMGVPSHQNLIEGGAVITSAITIGAGLTLVYRGKKLSKTS